jgi:hypothetical protein
MDDEMMKLRCLELASSQGLKGDQAREEARKMFNQIKGRSEGYGAEQPPKAKIVGKDGDLPDYVKE